MSDDPPRPDSSKRLQSAMSHVSSAQMKAVRAEVQTELKILGSTPSPTIGNVPAFPPIPVVPPTPPAPIVSEVGRPTLRTSDIEDLQKAAKVADDFMTGMDRIADVLMLLVLKFGRASTLMRAVVLGLMLGVVLLAANIFVVWNISTTQTDIQEKQGKIQEQQAQILSRQRATQQVAGEAKQKAEAAEQKVQKAPEVGVDSKGRPQLIVKVPDPEGAPGKTTTQIIRLPTAH